MLNKSQNITKIVIMVIKHYKEKIGDHRGRRGMNRPEALEHLGTASSVHGFSCLLIFQHFLFEITLRLTVNIQLQIQSFYGQFTTLQNTDFKETTIADWQVSFKSFDHFPFNPIKVFHSHGLFCKIQFEMSGCL